MLAFYSTLESEILKSKNEDEFKYPDTLPSLLKGNKQFEAAAKKAVEDAKGLIEQYKIEQNRFRLTKGLRSIYQTLRSVFRNAISLIYNVHEAIDIDKHLYNTNDLADKIIEASVERVMGILDQTDKDYQTYDHTSHTEKGIDRAEQMNSFREKLEREVLISNSM